MTTAVNMLNFTPLNIENSEEDDWREVFDLLDPKDGVSDGQIDKKAFIEWIDTLSFQDSVMLEARNGISRTKLKYLINSADVDENNFLDKQEFMNLIQNYSHELEKIQQNNFHKYLRIAAYAEEYKWWPPPCFTLLLTLVNVSVYVYHVTVLSAHGQQVSWSGPVPLCSLFIFNPDLRYQVS